LDVGERIPRGSKVNGSRFGIEVNRRKALLAAEVAIRKSDSERRIPKRNWNLKIDIDVAFLGNLDG